MKNVIREINTLQREIQNKTAPPGDFLNRGLNLTQMQIMHYLFTHPDEEVCQRDLEEYLHLKKATIAEALNTMEVKGLIEREVSAKDRRRNNVVFSRSEKEAMRECCNELDLFSEKITEGIAKEDLDTFYAVIDHMKENLEGEVR